MSSIAAFFSYSISVLTIVRRIIRFIAGKFGFPIFFVPRLVFLSTLRKMREAKLLIGYTLPFTLFTNSHFNPPQKDLFEGVFVALPQTSS